MNENNREAISSLIAVDRQVRQRRNPVGTTKFSTVSTGSLKTSLPLHVQPINPVVFRGSQAIFISRGASRLDAFSGYPCPT